MNESAFSPASRCSSMMSFRPATCFSRRENSGASIDRVSGLVCLPYRIAGNWLDLRKRREAERAVWAREVILMTGDVDMAFVPPVAPELGAGVVEKRSRA